MFACKMVDIYLPGARALLSDTIVHILHACSQAPPFFTGRSPVGSSLPKRYRERRLDRRRAPIGFIKTPSIRTSLPAITHCFSRQTHTTQIANPFVIDRFWDARENGLKVVLQATMTSMSMCSWIDSDKARSDYTSCRHGRPHISKQSHEAGEHW